MVYADKGGKEKKVNVVLDGIYLNMNHSKVILLFLIEWIHYTENLFYLDNN